MYRQLPVSGELPVGCLAWISVLCLFVRQVYIGAIGADGRQEDTDIAVWKWGTVYLPFMAILPGKVRIN